jgi:hypothetical protein
MLSSAFDGIGGSTNLALDGLDSSGLGVTFGGSTLSSAHDSRSTLGSAFDSVGSSPLSSAPVGSSFGSVISGLGSSMLNSALDGLGGPGLDGVSSSELGFTLESLSLSSVLVDLGGPALSAESSSAELSIELSSLSAPPPKIES